MVDFLIFIELLLMLAVPILLIIWFVFLILKKKHKPIGIAALICIAAFFINGIGTGTVLEQEEKEKESVVLNEESTQEIPPENEVTTTTNEEAAPGGSRTNPIVVTVSQLANEINSNTDAAKEKYNNKYVQVTGEITQVVDGGSMMGYYLYGQRGVSGLRIVCWKNGDIDKVGMRGKTRTFLGQMREVSTVNTTDIGDCEIIE